MIPGWIDLQVNGYKGIDFSEKDLEVPMVEQVSLELLQKGTIAYCPTIITSDLELYKRNLPILAEAMSSEQGARILGIHVEGPFLNPRDGYRGFHPKRHIIPPSIDIFKQFQDWSENNIAILTLAPEQEGASELIKYVVKETQCTVSMGHHDSKRDDVKHAVELGVKMATHVGNGLNKQIHRFHNPLWPILAEDRLYGCFITDGFHLPDDLIKTAIRAKRPSRFMVTSDVVHYAGLAPGNYVFHDGPVVLEPSGYLHRKGAAQLAGSTSTMLECMNHLASLGELELDELEDVGYKNQLEVLNVNFDPIQVELAVELYFEKDQFFLKKM